MRISPCFAWGMILVNPCFIQIKHNGRQWMNEVWALVATFNSVLCFNGYHYSRWRISYVTRWLPTNNRVTISWLHIKNGFSSDNVWIVNLTELVCSTTDTCYFNSTISTSFDIPMKNTVINENCCMFMMAISQSPWSPYPSYAILIMWHTNTQLTAAIFNLR